MVLELKVPHGHQLSDLFPLWPKFISYVMSFVYIGIYWNNHHHLLHTIRKVSGGILWANMHLLFWLSIIPFVTGWMGENHFEAVPVALYGACLLMAAIAYYILSLQIIKRHGKDSLLAKAIGNDFKGKASIILYLTSMISAFWMPVISGIIYGLVAMMWLIPDTRIEKAMRDAGD
jgi:uncharacterized membrane protein